MIYNIASKIALNLVPKLAEEVYDYIVDNIDDVREYMADAIKPTRTPEKPTSQVQVDGVVTRFTKPQIRWIQNNYKYFKSTGTLINGTTIDNEQDFAKYCNEAFNTDKSIHVYHEVARLGYKYYANPHNLSDGPDLPRTNPDPEN